MKKVVIVDYGLGNLYSIDQACRHFGYSPIVSGLKDDIQTADSLILPGIGAFSVAMQSLKATDLLDPIKDYASSGRPMMGVCLGMQLLFDCSEEFGEHEGLGLIKGRILRFPSNFKGQKMKVPNIGWSKISQPPERDWSFTPLKGINPEQNHMYFIHSYFATTDDEANTLCLSSYNGMEYTSGVKSDNIWGFQFHPEKSGEEGIKIYKNFLQI